MNNCIVQSGTDGKSRRVIVQERIAWRRFRKGAVACEAALITPVIMLFALGAADFGRIVHYQQVVSNAARSAADVGATRQFSVITRADWEADVRQAAMDELRSIPGFDETRADISLTVDSNANDVTRIHINVAYPFNSVANWPGLPSEVALHQQLVAHQFR